MSILYTDKVNSLAGKGLSPLAWVNFNGTGVVAIRSSFNVSSITDNGTGDYTINFTTPLSDANYLVIGTAGVTSGSSRYGIVNDASATTAKTTSACRITIGDDAGTINDSAYVNVMIFGT